MSIGNLIKSFFLKKRNGQVVIIDHWWSYLASYEAGLGSTRLNLYFKNIAPIASFGNLVVTGTRYTTSRPDNLPAKEELERLNSLNDHVVSTICERYSAFYVGTFTHNKEQLNYFYVSSSEGVRESLEKFYASYCSSENYYISITEDSLWTMYIEFLYPNEKTIKFYEKELVNFGYVVEKNA